MKRIASCFLLCFLAASCAAEAVIVGEEKVAAGRLVRLSLSLGERKLSADGSVSWKVRGLTIDPRTKKMVVADYDANGGKLLFTGPSGTYRVEVTAVDFTAKFLETGEREITIGDGAPDPGPGPGPGPDPTPGTTPMPAKSLRCLIIYETATAGALPAKQQLILYGKAVRDYLNAKCDLEADGTTRGWRIWDKDVDTANVPAEWKTAMARKRDSIPWVIVGNDKGGYEGPLPADPDTAIALFKKYGG